MLATELEACALSTVSFFSGDVHVHNHHGSAAHGAGGAAPLSPRVTGGCAEGRYLTEGWMWSVEYRIHLSDVNPPAPEEDLRRCVPESWS